MEQGDTVTSEVTSTDNTDAVVESIAGAIQTKHSNFLHHFERNTLRFRSIHSHDYPKLKQFPIVERNQFKTQLNNTWQLGESRESYRNCIENNLTFDNYLNFIIILVHVLHTMAHGTAADTFNRTTSNASAPLHYRSSAPTIFSLSLCFCVVVCSWPCYERHSIRVAQVAASSQQQTA